jgi:hypothetical protein
MPGKIKMGKISPKPKPGFGINPPKKKPNNLMPLPVMKSGRPSGPISEVGAKPAYKKTKPGKTKPGYGINPPKKTRG